ncbi:hypothetical protein [Hyphomonas sp.]|uniref:hypothetical protein n=1 Tax=Hyphomonas sp. TaxID=87 RepID=UPI0025C0DA03|nr:hypothetical protein [Hyphomonas sp.]
MPSTCLIAGCRRASKRHSPLCSTHQQNQRRHGHALQRPFTKGELTRAKTLVRQLIDSRSNAEAVWAKLIASLEQVRTEALAEVRQMETSVHFRWKLAAERDIVTTCQEAQAEDIILTMVALGYMSSLDDRRFETDTAWFMTAGRRFRLLARSNYTATTNPTTGKRHWTPTDVAPKRLQHLGVRLMSVFAPPGFALRSAEVITAQKRGEARTAAAKLITGDKP